MFLLLSIACKEPAQAPQEYEELIGYIFEHTDAETDEELVAGLTNLQDWLNQNDLTELEEGSSIACLPKTAIENLEGEHNYCTVGEDETEDMKGVTMLTQSQYSETVLMEALTQYSFAEIMPDTYLTYDRQFDQGQECISDHSCLFASATAYTIADWGILGEVEAQRIIEFRWVQLENEEWVFLQRWWLTEPSNGSKLDLVIDNQYYIGINYPQTSGTQRLHASWIRMESSLGDGSESAAQQLIRNWQKDAEELDLWISENL
ncbi:MAG: hypothetical protein CMK59_12840 [Proteobacteria bacterium]|nr:hypothetical protein [Pseudomonadota bacterium]